LNTLKTQKNKGNSSAFKRLSIQQRLPFLICILLLTVIFTFSWVSYIGVKNASIAIGSERLTTLVDKLSLIFKQSIDTYADTAKTVTTQKSVKNFLTSRDEKSRRETIAILKKFQKKDSLRELVQLLDAQKKGLVDLGDSRISPGVNIDSLTRPSPAGVEYTSAGRFILYKGSMYYPVISSITNEGKTVGYAVSWNKIRTTRANIEQLTQLLGSNGKLYFGNDDGKFWTDLLKPVAKPPVDLEKLQQVAQYTRPDGEKVLASMRGVPGSRWLVLVELSSASFLKTANLFLRWVIILGITLVIAGSVGGWIMSRNITRPLHALSKAASAIAEGDYSSVVDIDRQDELGKLAESFNIMTVRVRSAQQELEQKVQDRTKELQTAMTDISDQKENEKKKDEFISIASHELKTPLTTIKAFFQLAKREIHPEFKSFNFLGIAARQLNRMEQLIGDLLDVSKINSGKMQYNLEDFDFDELLRDAIDSVQEISPKHTLVLEKSASIIFHGDRQRIEQVIINLLDNAVKYSPDADKVLVRAELQGGKLQVTIKDFGIGIAKKHLTDLFDKFYRVDLQHRFQGLGLGLFISSEIVKRHGGTIWVTSEPSQGAAFTFELPVKVSVGSAPLAVQNEII